MTDQPRDLAQDEPLDESVSAAGRPSERPAMRLASVSAFFPCYNDSQTIGGLVHTVEATLKQITDDYEIIVVNDCSTDDSAEVLARLQQDVPRLRVVTHEKNRGYGGALVSGFMSATKDYVFYTDGDGQYDPGDLMLLAR